MIIKQKNARMICSKCKKLEDKIHLDYFYSNFDTSGFISKVKNRQRKHITKNKD